MSEVPKVAFALLLFASTSLHKRRRLQRSRAAEAQSLATQPAQPALLSSVEAYDEVRAVRLVTWQAVLRVSVGLLLLGLVIGYHREKPHLAGAAALMLPGWYFLPWWRRVEAGWPARGGQQGSAARLLRNRGQRRKAVNTAAYLQLLQGSWIKDKVASDSMEPALEMVHLGRLMRSAVRLVKGIRLRVYDNCFEMAVFSAIPWFKVIEKYPLSGSSVTCKRRDLRRGSHRGNVSMTADGELQLAIEWGAPHGGSGTEVYSLVDADTLNVTSTMTVGGRTIEYTNVHKRK